MVEGCSPSGCKASIASCQEISEIAEVSVANQSQIMSPDNFSCVKPKTSIQQTYFDPTAIEPGSWKDSSIEKYTHESESSSLGGELLWDHQAETSLNTKSNFQKAIET